ncbi:hypothetical protein BC937DRAFT_92461 [Endogone sp. FLAS-F59071]|nr:hypothetical protein BC937DRAFT_92461 [Endogone sp. FLAS-F59071]|eukprot:RUS15427.1 hypothetical protein BC937DRAFT_92461 [Endogone sp. FLAS-F59071]
MAAAKSTTTPRPSSFVESVPLSPLPSPPLPQPNHPGPQGPSSPFVKSKASFQLSSDPTTSPTAGSSVHRHRHPQSRAASHFKNSSSKYDFVKVRVYLSEKHCYVLSRFLVCRMLTATKVDATHALRIALDLKKRLVEKGNLDVTQRQMEHELFELMRGHGYGMENIRLYRVMSNFHHQRIPLIILIAGTGCTGKSTIAMQLAERLNLSSVLKTDLTFELIHSIVDGKSPDPLWLTPVSDSEFMKIFDVECDLVKQGLNADLRKTFIDGKSVIIEGSLINHALLDHIDHAILDQTACTSSSSPALNAPCKSIPPISIVVPFLLTIHSTPTRREFIDDWISDLDPSLPSDPTLRDLVHSRVCLLQDTLIAMNEHRECTGGGPKFHRVEVNAEHVDETLDWMHRKVLERIGEVFPEMEDLLESSGGGMGEEEDGVGGVQQKKSVREAMTEHAEESKQHRRSPYAAERSPVVVSAGQGQIAGQILPPAKRLQPLRSLESELSGLRVDMSAGGRLETGLEAFKQ